MHCIYWPTSGKFSIEQDVYFGSLVQLDDMQHIAWCMLKQPTFTRGLECIEVQVCV